MIDAGVASEAEVERIAALRSDAVRAVDPQRGGASHLETVSFDADVLIAGRIDGEVVGYGAVRHEGDRVVLSGLWVDPEAREVGVGDAILSATIAWARARGAAHLDGYALPGDRSTKNFFESHGMKSRLLVVHREL